MEIFGLDYLELEGIDCCKWSPDNHICIVCRNRLVIFTPPFERLTSELAQRAKVEVGGQVKSASWSPTAIDGYHRLAVLLDNGHISIFGPRMNPAWNRWRELRTEDVDACCFSWLDTDIVYGKEDGSIWCHGGQVRRRAGHIPTRMQPDGNRLVVGWSDGVLELIDLECIEHVIELCNDGIWSIGPIFDSSLFTKINVVYTGGICKALPVLYPIVGLSRRCCATADGSIYDIQTLKRLDLPNFAQLFGLCECPCGGFTAVVGLPNSADHPVLAIFKSACLEETATEPTVDSGCLCDRWLFIQQHDHVPSPITVLPSNEFNVRRARQCVFCKTLDEHDTTNCPHCNEFMFKVLEV